MLYVLLNMKLPYIFTLSLTATLLTSCHNSAVQSYRWEHRQNKAVDGTSDISQLYRDDKPIYGYINNPTIGVQHRFMDGYTDLFSLSDGTGKDILGRTTTAYSGIDSELSFFDLNMDGKIDMIMYGDLLYGRFKDNKFAPVAADQVGQTDPLEYFSRYTSSQITHTAQ